VDLLVGGFPCQDLSVAGKRAGLSGERSGLFYEIVRLAKELQPTWGLFENVPGLISSNRGRDLWLVLRGLRECWPAVGWRVLDSRHFGVAQRRRRVFIVCGPTEAGVAEVLALAQGGEGDLEAGGEAGARAAAGVVFGTLNSGGNAGGFRTEPGEHVIAFDPTTSLDQAPHATLSPPLKQGSTIKSIGWAPAVAIPISADALRGEGSAKTPSADAEGRVRLRDPGLGIGQPGDPADTLAAAGPGAVAVTEPFTLANRGRGDSHQLEFRNDGTANAILTPNGGRGGIGVGAVAFAQNQRGELRTSDIAPQLTTGGGKPGEGYPAAQVGSAVRRLTPVECERLQGFPDGWTCLCQPLKAYAEDADRAALRCTCPDSPRYRALGNAVTVNVIEALGARLLAVLTRAGQA
jgi:DNA (cytosine-5)-methyltransferase 1